MNKIIFSLLTLILALNVASPALSSSFKSNMIKGVKFLDDVEEVEWYKVEGKSLIIGWKGVPKYLRHTNRKAAIRGNIATGREIHVWAVRHTQKKWQVGSGKSYICFVSAINGRVKTGNCKR
ncbi:MAG: hypothetical protein JKY23_03250 [Nitrospinaceae bacterium]|nr:hypothetical protein [Nitrospinaceae bacterium]